MSSPIALAHPVGGKYLAHQLGVSIRRDAIIVDYAVEAPLAVLISRSMPPDADFDQVILQEIRSGLLVTVDGATVNTVDLHAVPSAFPPTDGGSARVYRVSLQADVALSGEHEISVSNGNFPDSASFFASAGMVTGDIDVASSSVVEVVNGDVRDRSQRYELGDSNRTLTVAIDARDDTLARTFHQATGAKDAILGLAQAQRLTFTDSIKQRRVTPEIALVWLFAALLCGLASGGVGAQRQHKRPLLDTLAIFLAAYALFAGPWWTTGAVGAVASVTSLAGALKPGSVGMVPGLIAAMALSALSPFVILSAAIIGAWFLGATPLRWASRGHPGSRWLGGLTLAALVLVVLPFA